MLELRPDLACGLRVLRTSSRDAISAIYRWATLDWLCWSSVVLFACGSIGSSGVKPCGRFSGGSSGTGGQAPAIRWLFLNPAHSTK